MHYSSRDVGKLTQMYASLVERGGTEAEMARDASELQAASSPRPAAAPAATDGLGHTQAMVLPTKLALAASGGQISSVCCTGSLVAAAGADGVISLWSCGSYQPHGQ